MCPLCELLSSGTSGIAACKTGGASSARSSSGMAFAGTGAIMVAPPTGVYQRSGIDSGSRHRHFDQGAVAKNLVAWISTFVKQKKKASCCSDQNLVCPNSTLKIWETIWLLDVHRQSGNPV